MPLGVCAPGAWTQTPPPAWEGTLDGTARTTRCPPTPDPPALHLGTLMESRLWLRSWLSAHPLLPSVEGPPSPALPDRSFWPLTGLPQKDPAGPWRCVHWDQIAIPLAASLGHRPRVTSGSVASGESSVPWTGWPWNFLHKVLHFQTAATTVLAAGGLGGYNAGRSFPFILPADISLGQFCFHPRE